MDVSVRKSWRMKIHEYARLLFDVVFVLYLVYQFLRTLSWEEGYLSLSFFRELILALASCRYLFFALALEKILWSWKKGLPILGLLLFSWFVFKPSHNYNNLFDLLAFALLSGAEGERSVLRRNFFLHSGMILFLAFVLIPGKPHGIYSDSWGASFGFGNENTTAAFLLSVLLLAWLLWLKKHKVWTFVVFWMAAYPVYRFQGCVTVALLLLLFPVLAVVVDAVAKGKHAGLLKASVFAPLFVMLVSVGITLWLATFETVPYWPDPWLTFSQRFGDAANLIKTHGVTWFGPGAAWTLGYTTDNLFLNQLVCHGIAAMLITFGVFTLSMWKLYQRKRYDLLTVMLLFMVYSFMEGLAMVMLVNCTLALICAGETGNETTEHAEKRISWPDIRNRLLVSAAAVLLSVSLCTLIHWETVPAARQKIAEEQNNSVTNLIYPDEPLLQSFQAQEPFSGVSLLMATYQTAPEAEIRAILKDDGGNILEEREVRSAIRDNEYLDILFAREHPAGRYFLSLEGDVTGGKAAVWQDAGNPYAEGAAFEEGEETGNDWIMSLIPRTEELQIGRAWITAVTLAFLALVWAVSPRNKSGAVQSL